MPGDAEALAPSMRPGDAAEALALGASPIEALSDSVRASSEAYAVELGGELAGLFGVAPGGTMLGGVDVAWLLTGAPVDRHPLPFARASASVLRILLSRHPTLYNTIDARYRRALAWAKWLRAELGAPFGANGITYVPVTFRRSSWA